MNFNMLLQVDSFLFNIKEILKRKHGQISNLILCKNEFKVCNEMIHDMKTLKDYGIQGGCRQNPPVVHLYYDFKQQEKKTPDPILLAWPN